MSVIQLNFSRHFVGKPLVNVRCSGWGKNSSHRSCAKILPGMTPMKMATCLINSLSKFLFGFRAETGYWITYDLLCRVLLKYWTFLLIFVWILILIFTSWIISILFLQFVWRARSFQCGLNIIEIARYV